jgi:hypothetical protein
VVVEDSEDSHNKKKMTVKNLVGYSSPRKLDPDLGCQLLYLFNNDYTNSGPLVESQVDPLGVGMSGSRRMMFLEAAGLEEGRWFYDDGNKATSYTISNMPVQLSPTGELTVQWLGIAGSDPEAYRGGTSSDGMSLFASRGQNRWQERVCWGLFLHCDGVDAKSFIPDFVYSSAASPTGTPYHCKDDSFVLAPNMMYHIVGRRQDDGLGAGTFNTSLWVNGLKIAENLGVADCYGNDVTPIGDHNQVGHGSGTGNEGSGRWGVYCTKFSNTALTDNQINSEMKKALGYV